MVGGTRFHRWIHGASLGQEQNGKGPVREKTEPPARKLYVSLDRADNVIEGAPDFSPGSTAFRPCETSRLKNWGFSP